MPLARLTLIGFCSDYRICFIGSRDVCLFVSTHTFDAQTHLSNYTQLINSPVCRAEALRWLHIVTEYRGEERGERSEQ